MQERRKILQKGGEKRRAAGRRQRGLHGSGSGSSRPSRTPQAVVPAAGSLADGGSARFVAGVSRLCGMAGRLRKTGGQDRHPVSPRPVRSTAQPAGTRPERERVSEGFRREAKPWRNGGTVSVGCEFHPGRARSAGRICPPAFWGCRNSRRSSDPSLGGKDPGRRSMFRECASVRSMTASEAGTQRRKRDGERPE